MSVESVMSAEQVSAPARVAEPGEGISLDELALAARNHGIPLEALRYDVTPPGLHYLLIHYDIPAIEADSYRLTVGGLVGRPGELDLDELRRRPATTVRVTMECAGNGRAHLQPRPVSQPWLVEAVGTAEWTGVALRDILAEAQLDQSAVELVFTGADRGVERGVEQDYQRSLPVAEAMRTEMLLAYEMNGRPLPPQHGYPLRLVAPGWYGMAHVKWLRDITAVGEPFDGFQHSVAYRVRQHPDEPGTPVTRMGPRALVIPPGIPDFMSRTRIVRAGEITLEGRAWSGRSPVTSVEVSVDSGRTWGPAVLDDAAQHPWAWRHWSWRWQAEPGEHVLVVRATDAQGSSQPLQPAWNRGGFANNAVHNVRTICLPT
jgi:DMSO/TMAO reductase YedYZ molybdopterin-dependent catalytic subunit